MTTHICGALIVIMLCSGASAQGERTQWGEPIDGLRAGIEPALPDRRQWHPGEEMTFRVLVKSESRVQVPVNQLTEWVEEHVVTPDGKQYVRNFFQRLRQLDPAEWHRIWSWERIREPLTESRTLRLSGTSGNWYDAQTKRPAEVSFRRPGTYRMWVQCEATLGQYPPKNAWQGTAKSGEVSWEMAELPPEKWLRELTDEQRQKLETWRHVGIEKGHELKEWLKSQLALTENEPLAAKLLEIGKSDALDAGYEALQMLEARAGNDDDPGIDGPYLKDWSRCAVGIGADGQEFGPADGGSIADLGIEPALVYLRSHPGDHVLRDTLVKLARRSCRLHEEAPAADAPKQLRRIDTPTAWRVLLKLEVLKTGMNEDEAKEILGPPTSERDGRMSWVLRPGAHVSPGLSAELQDGMVVMWKDRRW